MREVLVVEDDPHLRKLIVFALGLDAELTVVTCGSGEEALELLSRTRPDVVLLDLEMPGIGGRETAIPVVVVSGSAGRDSPRLRELGVVDQLAKPVDPAALAALVTARIHATP